MMEMNSNVKFCEMTQDDMMVIEGGNGLLAAAAAVTAICAAGYGCYQLGVAVGKMWSNMEG